MLATARVAASKSRSAHRSPATPPAADPELYSRERYIAVTGRRFGAAPARLADLDDVISELDAVR
ncbi:hypothetical protein [Streptomyces sp. CBMA152]|uniref:hypothetical protein n=1 Tax=Streptomyces sp. CBMA152 TaxID=1896312 RepID=UPI001660F796|nr:hypothetical protein [Streptomyces sp. CBMA152]